MAVRCRAEHSLRHGSISNNRLFARPVQDERDANADADYLRFVRLLVEGKVRQMRCAHDAGVRALTNPVCRMHPQNIILTGPAGSGKTHLIKRVLLSKRFRTGTYITATTSIVATAYDGGMTLHHWAGLEPADLYRQTDAVVQLVQQRGATHRIRSTERLMVDEASMLHGALLVLLDRVLRTVRQRNVPLGGIQVVFVGDWLQLQPIPLQGLADDIGVVRTTAAPAEANATMPDAPALAFQLPLWRDMRLQIVRLAAVHRHAQADTRFLRLLGHLREGRLDDEDRALLDSLSRPLTGNDNVATVLVATNEEANRINTAYVQSLYLLFFLVG